MNIAWLRVFASALAFASSVFVSLNIHAQTAPLFQTLACPAVGDEYDQMISKLDAIKTSIKKDANCANVELKVKSLEDLVTKDRENVVAIVTGAQGQPLTAEQSQAVRDYAENVTKKVAALNDLFTQSNYCFRDDQPKNQLSALAGFVGEASQMVSSLAGPWGAPISLAGNVIAGFMTGLDAIYKSRAGFDYSKLAEWKSYVSNLCTYYSYRDQIQHLLDPQQRLAQLQNLKSRLDIQINFMQAACGECREMAQTFDVKKSQGPAALAMIFNQDIERADKFFPKPYGTYMLQSLGLRDWVTKEQVRVNTEAQSYWADAAGRHLLSQAKEDIENFLVTREAPKFLSYSVGASRADYGDFVAFTATEGRPLLQAFQAAKINLLDGNASGSGAAPANAGAGGWGWWTAPVNYFDLFVLRPIDWTKAGNQAEELQYQWSHFRDQGIDRFRNAQASTQMVQTFCSFFRHASLYSAEIRDVCSSSTLAHMIDEENSIAAKLVSAGVWGAAKPLNESDDMYLNRLEH